MDQRRRRSLSAIAAIGLTPLALIGGLAILGGAIGNQPNAAPCSGSGDLTGATIRNAHLNATQLDNAAIITRVGLDMHIPTPGETIALATALQESGLRNLSAGDRDSLGLFQQRPSQGWGTPAQILDPVHASHACYTRLLATPGWHAMTTTQAAQAVQHSATPEAYQRWQPLAQALVDHITDTTGACSPTGGPDAASASLAGYHIPAGTPAPIAAVIDFALHQLGKPYRYGATGPNAYDCSGLVQAAYAQIGIRLPRTTQQQAQVGTPVTNLTDLQPGDLLFEPGTDGTPTHPGHVGLYLGQGLIIQAPHTGADVDINTLTQWRTWITAVRRVA